MGGREGQIKFDSLRTEHIPQVARLHTEGISAGYISSLGEKFAEYVYAGIVTSGESFGFVAVEDGRVIGFITCADSVISIYKHILRNHFLKLFLAILPRLFRLSSLRNVLETLFYPSRVQKDLNCVEIVAIVVDEPWRGRGIGRSLIHKAVDETLRRGIGKIRVMVGDPLPANEFYKRLGFELVGQYRQHAHLTNLYVRSVGDNIEN
ncbi:MAG: GNAT family N-acetyltransferase [Planctomycetota bacterium]|jgi:GNAT superfamily N-acetyltransferase